MAGFRAIEVRHGDYSEGVGWPLNILVDSLTASVR